MGVGIIIILTGIMAALSGSYAMFTVFSKPWIAITLGMFWGVFIFFLDWFFIASMKSTGHNIQIILPRLLLGIFLALIIAKPLELRLFKNEIQQHLLEQQQSRQMDFKEKLNAKYPELALLKQAIKQLRNEMDTKEQQRNKLYNAIIAEAEGRSPTGQSGKGPVYKEKKQEFNRISMELERLKKRNNSKINHKEEKIDSIKTLIAREMEQHRKLNNPEAGFLEQFRAFNAIAKKDQVVQTMNWFIMLLFVLIETAPLLVKILSPYGPYDKLLETEENKIKSEAEATNTKLVMSSQNETGLQKTLAGMDYEFAIEQKRDFLQKKSATARQMNDKLVESWKNHELKKQLQYNGNGSKDKTAEDPTPREA